MLKSFVAVVRWADEVADFSLHSGENVFSFSCMDFVIVFAIDGFIYMIFKQPSDELDESIYTRFLRIETARFLRAIIFFKDIYKEPMSVEQRM